jgi:hypothetical protein
MTVASAKESHPMTEEIRDKARAVGLDRLTEELLAQFARATTAAR